MQHEKLGQREMTLTVRCIITYHKFGSIGIGRNAYAAVLSRFNNIQHPKQHSTWKN